MSLQIYCGERSPNHKKNFSLINCHKIIVLINCLSQVRGGIITSKEGSKGELCKQSHADMVNYQTTMRYIVVVIALCITYLTRLYR